MLRLPSADVRVATIHFLFSGPDRLRPPSSTPPARFTNSLHIYDLSKIVHNLPRSRLSRPGAPSCLPSRGLPARPLHDRLRNANTSYCTNGLLIPPGGPVAACISALPLPPLPNSCSLPLQPPLPALSWRLTLCIPHRRSNRTLQIEIHTSPTPCTCPPVGSSAIHTSIHGSVRGTSLPSPTLSLPSPRAPLTPDSVFGPLSRLRWPLPVPNSHSPLIQG